MTEFKKAIILLDEGKQNEGEVINIIICDQRGMQGLRLPANQTLWDCTQWAVTIGDRWEDGVFTREGEAVEPILMFSNQFIRPPPSSCRCRRFVSSALLVQL